MALSQSQRCVNCGSRRATLKAVWPDHSRADRQSCRAAEPSSPSAKPSSLSSRPHVLLGRLFSPARFRLLVLTLTEESCLLENLSGPWNLGTRLHPSECLQPPSSPAAFLVVVGAFGLSSPTWVICHCLSTYLLSCRCHVCLPFPAVGGAPSLWRPASLLLTGCPLSHSSPQPVCPCTGSHLIAVAHFLLPGSTGF